MKKLFKKYVIDLALDLIIIGVKIVFYSLVGTGVDVTLEVMTLPLTAAVKLLVKEALLDAFKDDIDDIKMIAAVCLLAK